MANQPDSLSCELASNTSLLVNLYKTLKPTDIVPASVNVDSDSVITSYIRKLKVSTIYNYTQDATDEEKERMPNKRYLCRYCALDNKSGHHTSTEGLRRHLKKHNKIWTVEENASRITIRQITEQSL